MLKFAHKLAAALDFTFTAGDGDLHMIDVVPVPIGSKNHCKTNCHDAPTVSLPEEAGRSGRFILPQDLE